MSRDPLIIAGGNAIMYASVLTLDYRKQALQDSDPITREEGIKVGVTVKKNHCIPDKNPYVKTEYFAVFGLGTERYLELLELAVEQGILSKGGNWIKDIDLETGEPKIVAEKKLAWPGKSSFREYCKANPEYFSQLQSRVKGEVVEMTAEEIAVIERDNSEIENSVSDELKEKTSDTKSKAKRKVKGE